MSEFSNNLSERNILFFEDALSQLQFPERGGLRASRELRSTYREEFSFYRPPQLVGLVERLISDEVEDSLFERAMLAVDEYENFSYHQKHLAHEHIDSGNSRRMTLGATLLRKIGAFEDLGFNLLMGGERGYVALQQLMVAPRGKAVDAIPNALELFNVSFESEILRAGALFFASSQASALPSHNPNYLRVRETLTELIKDPLEKLEIAIEAINGLVRFIAINDEPAELLLPIFDRQSLEVQHLAIESLLQHAITDKALFEPLQRFVQNENVPSSMKKDGWILLKAHLAEIPELRAKLEDDLSGDAK